MDAPVLYYVIPCYNEEQMLPVTSKRLLEKLSEQIGKGLISKESKVLFVNDGSKDDTWMILKELCRSEKSFCAMSLSRNRGHQNALLAGLLYAKDHADCVISMDADLQDDVDASDEMLERFNEGYDIVYGVRNSRETDSAFKRSTARMFYRFMSFLGADIVYDSADYRLMSKRALKGLEEFREVNLFLRGLVPMIGYPSAKVYYDRGVRQAGESKYPLRKMLAFSVEGITSLSVKPIRLITGTGLVVFLVSIILLCWGIVQWVRGATVPGWASLITSIWALGGLILLSVGIVGEYVGKIYLEAKNRPRFLIDEIIEN